MTQTRSLSDNPLKGKELRLWKNDSSQIPTPAVTNLPGTSGKAAKVLSKTEVIRPTPTSGG